LILILDGRWEVVIIIKTKAKRLSLFFFQDKIIKGEKSDTKIFP